LTANLITWLAFSFCFATICVAVEQIESGYVGSISESLATVRQRVGPFLRLSLLRALIFFVVEGLVGMLTMAIFWTVDRLHMHPTSLTRGLVIYLCFGVGILVFSRFALAIPALVLDDFGAVRSIFRSDELTRGKWRPLVVLLTKTLVGGYIAAMLPFWLARWIPLRVVLPSWFPWCLTAASVAAVTIVEPVMFIGFALLYLQGTGIKSSSKQPSVATVQKQKPAAYAAGLTQEEGRRLIFARAGLHSVLPLRLLALFEELHQAVNQPAAAANHVQPALVLMLF